MSKKLEEEGETSMEEDYYTYENNIETRHINQTNKDCICRVEQYLNLQRTFAPPESINRLEKHLNGVLGSSNMFDNEKKVEVKQGILNFAKCDMFSGDKRVRVDMKNSSFRSTQGAMHYMVGEIDIDAKISLSLKKRNEKPYPTYKGTGTVYLEPHSSKQYFLFVQVNGTVTVDKGLFVACEGSLKMETIWVKGLATKIFGGEGLTSHQFTGKGWLLIKLPVPPSEVQKIRIGPKRPLIVDGSFVILRRGKDIEFQVKHMAGKGLNKLFNATGEGIVCEFKGTGDVWLCPTMK